MKKFGFLIFLATLVTGLMFAPSCHFNNYKSVQGSGTTKTEVRNIKNFTKIVANGAVDVDVTVQKDFSVEVTADDNLIDLVKTESDGGTLKIYAQVNTSSKSKVRVKISMPELEKLDLSGASTGIASNVKIDSLELTSSGASKIKIDGQTQELKAQANGASTIDAENLKSENVDIQANGGSSATISVTGELKAEANGASTINYSGDPKNVKQNASGASSINKK